MVARVCAPFYGDMGSETEGSVESPSLASLANAVVQNNGEVRINQH